MFANSSAAQGDSTTTSEDRGRTPRHAVRAALITWPVVVCLGATVAAAACLIGECDKRAVDARETRVGHIGTVKSIAFRGDGEVLSSVGIDGSIVLWGPARCIEHPFLPDGPGQVRSTAFSTDNHVLATGNLNEPVALHNLVGRGSRSLLDPAESTSGAACLAFAPDGATLAVGQQDGQITLWDSVTLCKVSTLNGHGDFVASLAFSRDGTTIASSAGDRTVRVWDVPDRRERFRIQHPDRTFGAMSVSPDGRVLALGDRVGTEVRIWDLTSGQEAALHGANGAVVALAISPDGSTLAAADLQGFVTFWDVSAGEITGKRLKHSGVNTLAFAPDGLTLATGGFDGTIQIWDFPLTSVD